MKKGQKSKNKTPRTSRFLYHPDQAWTCTGCGKCCTMWDVPVTKVEKERIESLVIPGFDFENESYFAPIKRVRGIFMIKKVDCKCVFLADDGFCVIHKLHGEAVKALACRLYPLHILCWADGEISASLRFDCTAVAANHGVKLPEHEGEIRRFLPELEEGGLKSQAEYSKLAPSPPLTALRQISTTYQQIICENDHSLGVRLHYAASLLGFHSEPRHYHYVLIPGEDFESDAMAYLDEHAADFNFVVSQANPVDKIIDMTFNYLLSGFARVDEEVRARSFVTGRWGRVSGILRFILGKGSLRKLGREYPDTTGFSPLATLRRSIMDWESHQILMRHAAAQLKTLHFCGNPGPNLKFEEGMRHLVLAMLATATFASLYAAAEEDNKESDRSDKSDKSQTRLYVTAKHTAAAVRIVDHTFYHSPFFALRHVRK
ncbi:MAG: YkgJ family cysteine cluster protein, partial [Victivallales bacterium]|nr:YkgJ family cysteine cluster protein [Victivallales bacterium]